MRLGWDVLPGGCPWPYKPFSWWLFQRSPRFETPHKLWDEDVGASEAPPAPTALYFSRIGVGRYFGGWCPLVQPQPTRKFVWLEHIGPTGLLNIICHVVLPCLLLLPVGCLGGAAPAAVDPEVRETLCPHPGSTGEGMLQNQLLSIHRMR